MSINCHITDSNFAYSILNTLPEKERGIFTQGYNNVLAFYGRQKANLYLIHQKDKQLKAVETTKVMIEGDRDILIRMGKIYAYQCDHLIEDETDPEILKKFCGIRGIQPPLLNKDHRNIKGFNNRLKSDKWWLKKLVTLSKRLKEHEAIKGGFVHKGKSSYVSKVALSDYLFSQSKSKKFLKNSVMVNKETGEEISLETIFDASISAPENRRIELMIRAGGLEYCADNAGHEAYFITITCPSKYHAVSSKTLKTNPKYAGYTPKEASDYLTSNWSRIRARLDDNKIKVYGLRVSEPHHDGCPHWHMLLWGSVADLEAAYTIIRKESLAVDGDERGAEKRRVELEKIDRSKGSAVGYVAKYIAKNVNGNTGTNDSGIDFETGEALIETAVKVRAWSNLWGIRQFQFFGAIPVGIWRELRRLKEVNTVGLIDELAVLAGNGKKFDYGSIIEKIGGVLVSRKELAILITKEQQDGFDQWGEPKQGKVKGLIVNSDPETLEQVKQSVKDAVQAGVPEKVTCTINNLIALKEFVTRSEEWEIKTVEPEQEQGHESFDSALDLPWIHVNNCRNLHESEFNEKIPIDRGKYKNE